jgi:ribosomal protein S18 acetylase RimI-like enzyme
VRGATEVRLDVRERNRAAIALYEHKGFASHGDAVPEPAPNEHILEQRLVRRLQPAAS